MAVKTERERDRKTSSECHTISGLLFNQPIFPSSPRDKPGIAQVFIVSDTSSFEERFCAGQMPLPTETISVKSLNAKKENNYVNNRQNDADKLVDKRSQ